MWYIQTLECDSSIKKRCTNTCYNMDKPQKIMLSEYQTKKVTCFMILLIWNVPKSKSIETVVASGWGAWRGWSGKWQLIGTGLLLLLLLFFLGLLSKGIKVLWNLQVMIATQPCEYTKNFELYPLNGWITYSSVNVFKKGRMCTINSF